MGISGLQGRVLFFFWGSYSRGVSRRQSRLVLVGIILFHVLIILLMLNEKTKRALILPEDHLQMISLRPEREELIDELNVPKVDELKPIQIPFPQIQIAEPPLTTNQSQTNYLGNDLSDSAGQYGNVFDPKLRKKLMESQDLNRPRAQGKSKTWTAIDGRTYIELGDGVCMVSMPKVGAQDRANNWGATTCGKNDSEKAMDRVMADFESRKGTLAKP